MVITLAQATLYVVMGMYGEPSQLGLGICILIVVCAHNDLYVILDRIASHEAEPA
jgi:hypothetical protein